MKKIFLLLVAAVCTVASWAADATVSATVKGQKLEVALTNSTESFVAFQMDITLPTGVDVESAGAIVMNKERLTEQAGTPVAGATDANFIIAYNKIDETHVRVLAYNLENRALAGKEGALFTMSFTGETSENFTVDGIKFVTETELNEVSLAAAVSEATSSVPYDVNKDGRTDVGDLSAVVAFILHDNTNGFDATAANANGDDRIDVADLSVIVNYILK